MVDIQLTSHFNLKEFLRTSHISLEDDNVNYFCSHYDGIGVDRFRYLSSLLEDFRTELRRPIVITSGFRCPELNEKVGGVKGSAHLKCYAADFVCSYAEYIRLVNILRFYELNFDQFLCYRSRGFCHISIDPRNRRQCFSNLK